MLIEKLEIQAHFKVRFLRRNDEMTQIKNFQALKKLNQNDILPKESFDDVSMIGQLYSLWMISSKVES